jgi:hypothetical protein
MEKQKNKSGLKNRIRGQPLTRDKWKYVGIRVRSRQSANPPKVGTRPSSHTQDISIRQDNFLFFNPAEEAVLKKVVFLQARSPLRMTGTHNFELATNESIVPLFFH